MDDKPPIDTAEEACSVCGSPHIEYVTPLEAEEDEGYRECCTCGWRFDLPT